MEVALIQVLTFAAVLLLALGIKTLLQPPPKRMAVVRPGLFGLFPEAVQGIGSALESGMASAFPSHAERTTNLLMAAALHDRLTVRDVVGLQGLLASSCLGVTVVGLFVITLRADIAVAAGLLMGLLGWIYPSLWLARAARTRQEAISGTLPYALDLLTVAMQAGQDFGAAVRFLVIEGPKGPLSDEFSVALQEIELGKSRVEALKSMAGRIQLDQVGALVTAVVQSTEMGSNLTDTLKIQAEEIRRARFHTAERKAARAPSLMMIPVALFILPSVFIIILTPVILRSMSAFQTVR